MSVSRNCWKKLFALLAVCLLATLATSCAKKNRLVESWVDPAVMGSEKKLEDVLVIGVARDATIRRLYEDSLSRGLLGENVRTIQGHRIAAVQEEVNYDSVVQAAQETNAKTVMISRLTDASSKVTSGDAVGRQYGDLKGATMEVGMMAYTYPIVSSSRTNITVWLECLAYDVETKELVWSAQLETVDPKMTNKSIDKATQLFVQDLKAKGLL